MFQHLPADDRAALPRIVIEALRYADLGLRVIPLGEHSKTPMIERWKERATTEPDTIKGWFSSWPTANIAIVTGQGIIAIDIDTRAQRRGELEEVRRAQSLARDGKGTHWIRGHPFTVSRRSIDEDFLEDRVSAWGGLDGRR